jgi:hypothetical protein
MARPTLVMAGLVPVIHDLRRGVSVDARIKSGHDGLFDADLV